MSLIVMIAVCLGTVALVRVAVGGALPQTCPRRCPLPTRQQETVPLPVGVDRIRERLDLEERGLRWCRQRCGVA